MSETLLSFGIGQTVRNFFVHFSNGFLGSGRASSGAQGGSFSDKSPSLGLHCRYNSDSEVSLGGAIPGYHICVLDDITHQSSVADVANVFIWTSAYDMKTISVSIEQKIPLNTP